MLILINILFDHFFLFSYSLNASSFLSQYDWKSNNPINQSFFFIFWVRKTVLNASLVCALALLVQCGLDYLFNFFFFYKDSLYILTRQLLPGTLYTALCCPLILLAVLGIRRACLRGEGT